MRRRQHCQGHEHPKLKRPVPRKQVRAELADLYHQAGFKGPVDLEWEEQALRRTHDRNQRRYAQVAPYERPPHFELAPQAVYLPAPNRRGLLAHEVGHVLDPEGSEDDADRAAHEAIGVKIGYDHRWPGKGLQVARNPRRFLLDEIIELLEGKAVGDDQRTLMDMLRSAERVIAEEPMRWYFEESEREDWNAREDFRNLAPVHNVLWIEHGPPRFFFLNGKVMPFLEEAWSHAGTLLVSFLAEAEDDPRIRGRFPAAKWITSAFVFTAEAGGVGPKWEFIYGVEPDGTLSPGGMFSRPMGVVSEVPDFLLSTAEGYYREILQVAMLALYFMHAKGTELRPVRVPSKVAKARRRRGRPTGEGYKILDVGLGARRTLHEAKAEGGGGKGALRKHLRRGGFATYREERPHVSGFVGEMWRSPTVVGRGEEARKKAYQVRKGEGKKRKQKKRKRKKRNPDLPAPVRGGLPRQHSFEMLARGEAPLVYLPEGVSEVPQARQAMTNLITKHPLEGGLATPDAWEDLLAALGRRARVFVVTRNGERWEVIDVFYDPGGYTGQLLVRHQGRLARSGDRLIDLQDAYGYMIPIVEYRPVRR